MKKTKTITKAQATLIEKVLVQDLVAKANPNLYNVHFRQTTNYNSYADTFSIYYEVEKSRNTIGGGREQVLNGNQTKSLLWNCPLRIFTRKNVKSDWGNKDLGKQYFVDYAVLLMDAKGREIVSKATARAQELTK